MNTGLRILRGRYNCFYKIFCFGLLGIILLAFVLSYIPKKIDLTYPGIQYSKNDTTYVKKITIIVKGKLYKNNAHVLVAARATGSGTLFARMLFSMTQEK